MERMDLTIYDPKKEHVQEQFTQFADILDYMHVTKNGNLTQVEDENILLKAVMPFVLHFKNKSESAKNDAHEEFEGRIFNEDTLAYYIAQSPDNAFIIDEIITDYPRIIKKLEAAVQIAKTYKNNETPLKNIRMADGEELLFFFDRKVTRKNKQYLVGRNENQEVIALCYAYLWNQEKYNKPFVWEANAAYQITCNGIFKKRKRDVGYYTFSIKKVEEL